MTVDRTDVLIAGAGLAGSRTAECLRALGYDGRIVVAGDEPHPPYERPALSKEYLAGRRSRADLPLRDPAYWRDTEIELWPGSAVESLDLRSRRGVVDGRPLAWRHLVIATGVRGRRLPALDTYENAHRLRTVDDAARLGPALRPGLRLAIVGAGFVGLEVASTARELGAEVVVIDMARVPFQRTLGTDVGARLGEIALQAGVELHLGRSLTSVIGGRRRVDALLLDDGTRVECDDVLVGIGSLPNSELVAGALAIAPDGGVVVDRHGRTAAEGVYACGDVATTRSGGRAEHWSTAATSARSVAHRLVGVPAPDPVIAYFWTEQFGHRLQVVGEIEPGVSPVVEECDRGFTASYADTGGRLRAVALLDRPDLLAAARARVTGADCRAVA
jgi:3-phenylpropionate/trans-cinnamate dioxygenase ferredoxin reductase component